MNPGKTNRRFFSRTVRNASLLLPTILSTSLVSDVTNDKLQTILNRAPFGPLPPRALSDAEQAASLLENEVEDDTRPRLSETVRLSAMTRFNGVPAAGLIDLTSGRSFFLIEGQTLGGFKLDKVSFETSSVILTKDNRTEAVYLAFADGQPTNLLTRATSTPTTPPKPTDEPKQGEELNADHSPDLLAAATIVEPDGSTRISFRELHRLRVQKSREKAEREKAEREARIKLEREQSDQNAQEAIKIAEIAEQAEIAAEKLQRKKIIQAIKEGYDVELNFELTPEEAKDLAQAGFDIVVDDPVVSEQDDPAAELNPLTESK